MYHIDWQLPIILLLIPILIFGYWAGNRKKEKAVSYVNFPNITNEFQFQNWKTRLINLPKYLKLISICFFIIAMARPRKALVNESVKGNGIDIVIAMDVSASMLTQDFKPDRLAVSKKLASEFVDKRINDRIGLVIFSGESFTQCPLTTDHENLKSFIEMQQVGYLEDGTAIGMGLATAVNRIKESDAKSRIIILLTDGKNNRGYIDPKTGIDLAKALGIKVYTIGIGSDEPALGPVGRSLNGELIMDFIRGDIDEPLLKEIASETGGSYFRAKDEVQLNEVYNKIDKLETSERELAVLKRYKELYRWPLSIGLILLLLAIVSHITIFKKYPLTDEI